MTKYGCWYQWWVDEEAEFEVRYVDHNPEIEALSGLGAFINGFWIDTHGELCHEFERIRYWIPPGRIVRIEREIIEETDFYDQT